MLRRHQVWYRNHSRNFEEIVKWLHCRCHAALTFTMRKSCLLFCRTKSQFFSLSNSFQFHFNFQSVRLLVFLFRCGAKLNFNRERKKQFRLIFIINDLEFYWEQWKVTAWIDGLNILKPLKMGKLNKSSRLTEAINQKNQSRNLIQN